MAHTKMLSEAMEALLEKQSQWLQHLQQQNLSFVERLHQQNLRMVEQLDRMNQRMLTRMLELLREGVDKEDDITKDDGCAENHPIVDALQVFDKSLKRNTCGKSDEWLGEGQENLQEGSEVALCEKLGGLNPPNRLLAHDKLASNAQQEQQGNVQQLFDEMPKITVSNLDEHYERGEVYFKLDHINTKDHRWEWTKPFCFIAFDPGGMLSLSKWLPTDYHTIYNLEAVNVVFDPGKLVSSLYGGFSAMMAGQSVLKAELLVLLYAWLAEDLANCKLEVALLTFDPGGKTVAASENMRATNLWRCSHGVYVWIQLLVMLLVPVSDPKVTYGSVIKLMHERTKFRLHSHKVPYGSGQNPAVVVKGKANGNGDSGNPSYFSDTLAVEVYRIALLILKFLCLEAARRAEELGFIDLSYFPELSNPDILHGLQDQSFSIVTEVCEANRSKQMQPEMQDACRFAAQDRGNGTVFGVLRLSNLWNKTCPGTCGRLLESITSIG